MVHRKCNYNPDTIKKTILCNYCGKEIKITRNDVLCIKDVKAMIDSCCMKCKNKRIFQFQMTI